MCGQVFVLLGKFTSLQLSTRQLHYTGMLEGGRLGDCVFVWLVVCSAQSTNVQHTSTSYCYWKKDGGMVGYVYACMYV